MCSVYIGDDDTVGLFANTADLLPNVIVAGLLEIFADNYGDIPDTLATTVTHYGQYMW